MAANWGWADSDISSSLGEREVVGKRTGFVRTEDASKVRPSTARRPPSPQRPGSRLRPGSHVGGSSNGEASLDGSGGADAATAAAAALLEEQEQQRQEDAQHEEEWRKAAATALAASVTADQQQQQQNQQLQLGDVGTREEKQQLQVKRERVGHETRGDADDGIYNENEHRSTARGGRSQAKQPQTQQRQICSLESSFALEQQEQQQGLLTHAARIMAEDNDLDTKANLEIPGNHSAMPTPETSGVSSEAISRVKLEERPRFSVIDEVVGQFVQGFVELERRLHLSRAHTDRDFLSRLAEAQTRLLVEGDLGFGSGDGHSVENTSSINDDGSEDNFVRQQQQQLAAQAQLERDERLVTQLELHHGEISELFWSALATKGEVQRRGARELMDHAVTELRSCLEHQEKEFKAYAAWLRATCDKKIAAARVAGDTAFDQVSATIRLVSL